jgi:GR25 family glycosyltransferase involved in LPS biosynthesis
MFYRAEPQEDRDKGCIDSHMACLQYAVDQGVPHVLILEDDVLFQGDHLENMRRVVRFVQQHGECPFLHLGGFIFRKVEYLDDHFIRGAIMTTHAYVIRTEHAKRLLAERPRFSGMSVDTFFTIINRNEACVHINPLACIQRASESDGTWDSRDLGKTGWLGKAMIYSALPYRERLRFDELAMFERFKIEQGLLFFRAYRHIMRLKTGRARQQEDASIPHPKCDSAGELIEVRLPGRTPMN